MPILGSLISLYFLVNLASDQYKALGIALVIGAVAYLISMLAGGRVPEEPASEPVD